VQTLESHNAKVDVLGYADILEGANGDVQQCSAVMAEYASWAKTVFGCSCQSSDWRCFGMSFTDYLRMVHHEAIGLFQRLQNRDGLVTLRSMMTWLASDMGITQSEMKIVASTPEMKEILRGGDEATDKEISIETFFTLFQIGDGVEQFHTADANSDGTISFEEYKQMMSLAQQDMGDSQDADEEVLDEMNLFADYEPTGSPLDGIGLQAYLSFKLGPSKKYKGAGFVASTFDADIIPDQAEWTFCPPESL
jgi:Ca2+-binding EF-hand superfamily protein